MIYIKIKDVLYPAHISGKMIDTEWDGRESKSITLEMDYGTAVGLFVDGLFWNIVEQEEVPVYEANENGDPVQVGMELKETEWDNSEFNLAGDLTDHRDGRVTAKMGKLTDLEEAYEIMLGGM